MTKKEWQPQVCANKHCGREFVGRNSQQKTCCKECSVAYHSQMAKERYRAKVLASPPTEKARTKKVCTECGREFEAENPNTSVCSNECRKQRNRRQHREYMQRNNKETKRCCEQCGVEFTARGGSRFCSNECRGEYNKKLRQDHKKGIAPPVTHSKPQPKVKGLSGAALAKAQGILVTGKSRLQIAEEARAAGMSAGKYRALLQMQYEKEKGIGFYAR